MCNPTKVEKTFNLSDLAHFTGDSERYIHFFNKHVIYTPGIKCLADKAGAHWLVDAIASYYGTRLMKAAIAKDERLSSLHFWTLDVADDNSATLVLQADSGEEPAISQDIPFTDFSVEQIRIWAGFDGKYWTIYLPSEH